MIPRFQLAEAIKCRDISMAKKALANGADPNGSDYDGNQNDSQGKSPVWRLDDGRAALVAYEVYRGPGNRYGQVPRVVGRSVISIEIMLAIVWQVDVVSLSFDKVCAVMNFLSPLNFASRRIDESVVVALGRAV